MTHADLCLSPPPACQPSFFSLHLLPCLLLSHSLSSPALHHSVSVTVTVCAFGVPGRHSHVAEADMRTWPWLAAPWTATWEHFKGCLTAGWETLCSRPKAHTPPSLVAGPLRRLHIHVSCTGAVLLTNNPGKCKRMTCCNKVSFDHDRMWNREQSLGYCWKMGIRANTLSTGMKRCQCCTGLHRWKVSQIVEHLMTKERQGARYNASLSSLHRWSISPGEAAARHIKPKSAVSDFCLRLFNPLDMQFWQSLIKQTTNTFKKKKNNQSRCLINVDTELYLCVNKNL